MREHHEDLSHCGAGAGGDTSTPVGLTAAGGGFADGGSLWERLALMLVHPVTAILLLIIVALPTPSRNLLMIGPAVIVVNVIADVALALAISAGNTRRLVAAARLFRSPAHWVGLHAGIA